MAICVEDAGMEEKKMSPIPDVMNKVDKDLDYMLDVILELRKRLSSVLVDHPDCEEKVGQSKPIPQGSPMLINLMDMGDRITRYSESLVDLLKDLEI